MRLNTISPANSSKNTPKRVGRGIGSGLGKTCGRGHKGQKARSGGYHKVGFEGGQMPLQRRLPKFGFSSKTKRFVDEIRTSELNLLPSDSVTLEILKDFGLVRKDTKVVKIILSSDVEKAINVNGVKCTAGAKKAIEAAGGKVE